MEIAENAFIKYWIHDGILYSKYKQPIDLNLENSKEIIALRHQISDNKKQYWHYDISLVRSFSKEARDYAAFYGQDFLFASAIIVNSHVTMFLYRTFLKLKKLKVPVQAFTDKEKATNWLKEMKKRNEG